MKAISNQFYNQATQARCHAFIEFCGLMNEFIAICHEAEKRGIPWTNANTHSGTALPVEHYHAAYLAEKLNCIYGPALLADERIRDVFITTLFEGKFKVVPTTEENHDADDLSQVPVLPS